MKQLAVALKTELKLSFVRMSRYPVQALTTISILYMLFIGIFYGAHSIVGPNLATPQDMARSAALAIAGYLLWFFSLFAIDSMSQNIAEEAQTGTLEQLYLSRWSFSTVLFLRFLARILTSLSLLVPLFLLLSFTTGVSWDSRLGYALPVIVLTVLGLCGFGYMLGAMTLIFKRIGNIMTLVQFGLLFLCLSPMERLPAPLQWVSLTLPLAQGVKLLRLLLGGSGWQFWSTDFFLLCLNAALYLLAGLLIFRKAEDFACDRGLLGHY